VIFVDVFVVAVRSYRRLLVRNLGISDLMVGKVRGMRNIHGLDFKEVGEASIFLRFLLLWFVAFDV